MQKGGSDTGARFQCLLFVYVCQMNDARTMDSINIRTLGFHGSRERPVVHVLPVKGTA
jgi:hypothetical protein